jgi:hypothetical protein
VEVGVPNVPGRVNDGLEYFVLKQEKLTSRNKMPLEEITTD